MITAKEANNLARTSTESDYAKVMALLHEKISTLSKSGKGSLRLSSYHNDELCRRLFDHAFDTEGTSLLRRVESELTNLGYTVRIDRSPERNAADILTMTITWRDEVLQTTPRTSDRWRRNE